MKRDEFHEFSEALKVVLSADAKKVKAQVSKKRKPKKTSASGRASGGRD